MNGLVINPEKCVGCGLCVSACPSGALCKEGKLAVVDSAVCVLCGVCVNTCRLNAISIEKDLSGVDVENWHDVWVFVQRNESGPISVVLELLSRGRALADDLGEKLCAVMAGGTAEDCDLLFDHGADIVYHCSNNSSEQREEPFQMNLLKKLVVEYQPAILLFGATPFGRSLAPRLAAYLGTGLTADCTILEIDKKSHCLHQTRPAFGGNLMATIVCPNQRPQMATVRPGVLPIKHFGRRPDCCVICIDPPDKEKPLSRIISIIQATDNHDSICEADVIIAVGRGIGEKKNVKLAAHLAELLGGQLGCSRPIVESGWCAYEHQIGQTGVSVAPKLLIALGISGAVQHLAGIGGTERIIAVNIDPDAPIFSVAHEAVVGDCVEIIKEMIHILENK